MVAAMEAATPSLRRVPRQARSRAKVRDLLRAADRVLADEGAEALTTPRVAETAGVAVGTLYQYFDGKAALTEALALDYFERVHRSLAEVAARAALHAPADPVGEIIDAVALVYRDNPGFRELWFGGLRTERLRDVTRPGRARAGEQVVRVLAACAPQTPAERLLAVARMVVLTGDGLLREAFRVDPAGEEELIEEGKRMLRGYLAAELGIEEER